jgi:hypothetical protein
MFQPAPQVIRDFNFNPLALNLAVPLKKYAIGD